MYRIDKLFEDIFKPATKNELKQRYEKHVQSVINELIDRKDCIKHSDGSYSFKDDVDLSELNLIKLPIKFKQIDGNFYCSSNRLTSLKGAPEYVGGDFYCSFNELTNLQGAPKIVKGSFHCYDNQLTSLQGAPEQIGGDFNCHDNKLTSLKGAPKQVNGYFDCSYNKIKFIEDDVKKVCDVKGVIYV